MTTVSALTNVAPPTSYSSAATGAASGVGGTSGGGGGAGANELSLNVGGVSATYDIGPNTEAFAQQGYDYLDNSFSADSALLGDTIMNSEGFLSSLASPVLSLASSAQQFNTTTLPEMFQTLNNQNQSLGSQAVQAESGVAQASIAGSQAEAEEAGSGGGGLCFITGAVCRTFSLADNCEILMKLRAFRDSYMMETPERVREVMEYYDIAPHIVRSIDASPDAAAIYRDLYSNYIAPAVEAIDEEDSERAYEVYHDMVQKLRVLYG
jgi:hypothetical protein